MKKILLASLALLFTSAPLGRAGDAAPAAVPAPAPGNAVDDWLTGKYALGTFGGERDKLEAKGVDFFAFFTSDIAGNPVGGRQEGNLTYTHDAFFGVNLFLDKLLGWEGTKLVINGINRQGHSLTDRYVGSIYNSEQDYGGQTTFLYNVTLEKLFFGDKLSLKAGRMSASDDFNSSPIYNLYFNNGIDGDIRNVLFDTQFSAYPFATWAARLDYTPNKYLDAKVGVFQATADVFDRGNHGLDWAIRGRDGTFLIGQVEWSPIIGEQPAAPAGNGKDAPAAGDTAKLTGLPGHYILGGSLSPWKGYGHFGTDKQQADSYGFYAHADQMVYQEAPGSDQGLVAWTAVGYYPQEDISIVPFQVNAGLVYKGPFPTRDDDKAFVGLIYGKFSRDYARSQRTAGLGDPDYELVLEGDYRLQLTKFFYLQPDVQYTNNPHGTGRIPDSLVLGMQTGIVF